MRNDVIISQVIKAHCEGCRIFVDIFEHLVKIDSRVRLQIIHVLNDGEIAPCGDVLANESKDFFGSIYIFVDSFILVAVPVAASNREIVGDFFQGNCKLVRRSINQSTSFQLFGVLLFRCGILIHCFVGTVFFMIVTRNSGKSTYSKINYGIL